MFKKFFFAFLLTLLIAACNFSNAKINNARLARDPEGEDGTTVFTQDDTIYAVMDLENAPDTTIIQAYWYVVEAEGYEQNAIIDVNPRQGENDIAAELQTGSARIWFSLSPVNQGLSVGKYKVEIYVNRGRVETLEFEIIQG